MKKIKILFGLLSFLALGACEISEIESKKNDCEYYDFANSKMYNSTLLSEFEDERTHDKMLFYINQVISSMVSNSVYRNALLDKRNYDNDGEVDLHYFFENVEGFQSEFEANLNLITSCNGMSLSIEDLLSLMVMDSVNYFPSIYYLNIHHSSNEDKILLALGVESETEDFIESLTIDIESDSILESLVSEKDTNATYPILIVTSGSNYIAGENIPTNTLTTTDQSKSYNITVNPYKITHKWERTGKSEYTLYTRIYYSNSSWATGSGSGFLIKKIEDNQVNVLISNSPKTISIGAGIGFWGVTCEKDFYAKKKQVYVPADGGIPAQIVECKMKKADQYYQRITVDKVGSGYKESFDNGYLRISY